MKVLHTIPALDGGGADRVIYDYCIRMLPDITFDFIVHTEYKGILEDELVNQGCRIYHIAPAKKDIFHYLTSIDSIMKETKYDIVHVSQGFLGYIFIHYAKKNNIKIRIAHSHMAYIPENIFQKIKRKILTKLTIKEATDLFACGRDAAIWMWGEKSYLKGKVYIMMNGIDTKKFIFSYECRKELRNTWNLDGKIVIGNIGRLTEQKNQELLINVFKEVTSKCDKAVLVIIGRGELKEELERKVLALGLEQKVLFLGIRDDVSELLNMMDVFVLTSRYEGLPLVLIESQVNGLPIIVSNTITDEVKINNNYEIIGLEEDFNLWSESVIRMSSKRENNVEKVIDTYDINILATKQLEWYQRRIKAE